MITDIDHWGVLHKVKTLPRMGGCDGGGSGGRRECGMDDRACALSYVMSPLQGWPV